MKYEKEMLEQLKMANSRIVMFETKIFEAKPDDAVSDLKDRLEYWGMVANELRVKLFNPATSD